jgi:hypothetical protein
MTSRSATSRGVAALDKFKGWLSARDATRHLADRIGSAADCWAWWTSGSRRLPT